MLQAFAVYPVLLYHTGDSESRVLRAVGTDLVNFQLDDVITVQKGDVRYELSKFQRPDGVLMGLYEASPGSENLYFFASWSTPCTDKDDRYCDLPNETCKCVRGTWASRLEFSLNATELNIDPQPRAMPAPSSQPSFMGSAALHCCRQIDRTAISTVRGCISTDDPELAGLPQHSGSVELSWDTFQANSSNAGFVYGPITFGSMKPGECLTLEFDHYFIDSGGQDQPIIPIGAGSFRRYHILTKNEAGELETIRLRRTDVGDRFLLCKTPTLDALEDAEQVCGSRTHCGPCLQDARCAWCQPNADGQGQCIPAVGGTTASCPSGMTPYLRGANGCGSCPAPTDCSVHTTCSSCLANAAEGCGWCPRDGKCVLAKTNVPYRTCSPVETESGEETLPTCQPLLLPVFDSDATHPRDSICFEPQGLPAYASAFPLNIFSSIRPVQAALLNPPGLADGVLPISYHFFSTAHWSQDGYALSAEWKGHLDVGIEGEHVQNFWSISSAAVENGLRSLVVGSSNEMSYSSQVQTASEMVLRQTGDGLGISGMYHPTDTGGSWARLVSTIRNYKTSVPLDASFWTDVRISAAISSGNGYTGLIFRQPSPVGNQDPGLHNHYILDFSNRNDVYCHEFSTGPTEMYTIRKLRLRKRVGPQSWKLLYLHESMVFPQNAFHNITVYVYDPMRLTQNDDPNPSTRYDATVIDVYVNDVLLIHVIDKDADRPRYGLIGVVSSSDRDSAYKDFAVTPLVREVFGQQPSPRFLTEGWTTFGFVPLLDDMIETPGVVACSIDAYAVSKEAYLSTTDLQIMLTEGAPASQETCALNPQATECVSTTDVGEATLDTLQRTLFLSKSSLVANAATTSDPKLLVAYQPRYYLSVQLPKSYLNRFAPTDAPHTSGLSVQCDFIRQETFQRFFEPVTLTVSEHGYAGARFTVLTKYTGMYFELRHPVFDFSSNEFASKYDVSFLILEQSLDDDSVPLPTKHSTADYCTEFDPGNQKCDWLSDPTYGFDDYDNPLPSWRRIYIQDPTPGTAYSLSVIVKLKAAAAESAKSPQELIALWNDNASGQLQIVAVPAVPIVRDCSVSGNTPRSYLVLNGENFPPWSTTDPNNLEVKVGNMVAPLHSATSRSLIALIPEGAGQDLLVSVRAYSLAPIVIPPDVFTFTYARPTISSTFANPVPTTSGGTSLVILGANFGTRSAQRSVTIDGAECDLSIDTCAQEDSCLRCLIPAGTGAYARIIVTVGGQTVNTTMAYAGPVIAQVLPSSFVDVGSLITIQGQNFGNLPYASNEEEVDVRSCSAMKNNGKAFVAIGRRLCVPDESKLHLFSHSQILCRVPSGSGLSIPLDVCVNRQAVTTTVSYNPPVVTSVERLDGESPTKNATFILVGKNFGDSGFGKLVETLDSTKQNTVATLDAKVENSTHIVVTNVSAAVEKLYARVSVSGQHSDPFDLVFDPPIVREIQAESFVLTQASTGRNHTSPQIITIIGENFGCDCPDPAANETDVSQLNAARVYCCNLGSSALSVYFNQDPDFACIDVQYKEWGRLECELPEFRLKYGTITGIIPYVSRVGLVSEPPASPSVSFSYGLPKVTSVYPDVGETADAITIYGENLGLGGDVNGLVQLIGNAQGDGTNLNEVQALLQNGELTQLTILQCDEISQWTHDAIICIVPEGSGVNLAVRVHTIEGVASDLTADARFSFASPIITSVSPKTGPTAGGASGSGERSITIRGRNFGMAGEAYVGDVQCGTGGSIDWQPTIVTCTLPPGRGVNLTVSLRTGSQETVFVDAFNYSAPRIDSMTPLAGHVVEGSTSQLTIYGANFGLVGADEAFAAIEYMKMQPSCFTVDICSPEDCTPGERGGFLRVKGPTSTSPTSGLASATYLESFARAGWQRSYSAPGFIGNGFLIAPTVDDPDTGLPVLELDVFIPYSGVYKLEVALVCDQEVDILVHDNDATVHEATVPALNASTLATAVFTYRNVEFGDSVKFPLITKILMTPHAQYTYFAVDSIRLCPDNDTQAEQQLFLVDQATGINRLASASHTQLLVNMPHAVGKAWQVILKPSWTSQVVQSQTTFSYEPPKIVAIRPYHEPLANEQVCIADGDRVTQCPRRSATGDARPRLVIVGQNFASVDDLADDTLNDQALKVAIRVPQSTDTESMTTVGDLLLECTVLEVTTTEIVIRLPDNERGGLNLPVVVTVRGQSAELAAISYDSPRVVPNSLRKVTDRNQCRAALDGTSPKHIVFTNGVVMEWICMEVEVSDTEISPPEISIELGIPGYEALPTIVKPLSTGHHEQTFGASVDIVTAQRSSVPSGGVWFPCPDAKVLEQDPGSTRMLLSCMRPDSASGRNLRVRVTINGIASSLLDGPYDTVSYPLPKYLDNSIRGVASASGSDMYQSMATEADWIVFDVNGLPSNIAALKPYLRVFLAPPLVADGSVQGPAEYSNPNFVAMNMKIDFEKSTGGQFFASETDDDVLEPIHQFDPNQRMLPCTSISFPYVDPAELHVSIRCLTAAGLGGGHSIVLMLLGVPTAPSNDKFAYHTNPPVVTQLRGNGCTASPTNPNMALVNCPTSGFGPLEIRGRGFCDPDDFNCVLTIKVGPYECDSMQMAPGSEPNDQTLTCTVPAGTGHNHVVTVIVGKAWSHGNELGIVPTVSFADPIVTAIRAVGGGGSCQNLGTSAVRNCNIEGGDTVEIQGDSFSTRGMIVLVGGRPCNSVYHISRTRVQCVLPPGRGPHELVYVISRLSMPATSQTAYVGYAQCTPGTYRSDKIDSSTVCVECPVGSYASEAGSTTCAACPEGKFQDEVGASACKFCEGGKFSQLISDGDASTIGVTGPGSYSNPAHPTVRIGPTACMECEAGKISADGSGTCTSCPTGRFQNETGKSECRSCESGYFSTRVAATACHSCRAGSYSLEDLEKGVVSCTPCPIGKYADKRGMSYCRVCEDGMYANSIGMSECVAAPPGRYAYVLAGVPVAALPCEPGYFSTAGGHCEECDVGRSSAVAGGLTAITLAAGQTACSVCNAGTYQPAKGQSSCLACEPGTYSPVPESTECLECKAGTYAALTQSTTCLDCPLGKVASSDAASACTECDPGSFANSTGLSECFTCEPGKYQPDRGASDCKPCEVGRFQPEWGRTACELCPPGAFVNVTGAESCIECEAGSFRPITAEEDEPCQFVEPGYYQPDSGKSTQLPCPAGTKSAGHGATVCEDCEAGTYSFAAASACKACPPGTFSDEPKTTACSACGPGKFSVGEGNHDCNQCEPGKYQDLPQQTTCVSCKAGRYAATPGAITCAPSGVGHIVPEAGANKTEPCPAGSEQPKEAGTACILCVPGTYSPAPGQAKCAACPTGQFSASPNATECDICNKGTFAAAESMLIGAKNCTPCAPGKFVPADMQGSCHSCPVGTYQPGTGETSCLPCEPGTFSNQAGATVCEECRPGSYAPTQYMSACLDCGPGTFQNISGQETCISCPKGSFQGSSGAIECELCNVGTFSAADGSESCSPCSIGSYQASRGKTECELCDPGHFANVTGLSVCAACPRGKAAISKGATECDDCKPGQFSPEEGASECENCAAGKAQQLQGQDFCESCPPGKYSAGGASECELCSENLVTPYYESTTCYQCDPTAQASTDGTRCQCPAGQYFPVASQAGNATVGDFTSAKCLSCPEGGDCASRGVELGTMQALEGWWRPHPDSSKFYRCINPIHCTPNGCAPNRYGPICAICVPGSREITTGECVTCEESVGANVLQMTFIIVAIIVAIFILCNLILFSDRDLVQIVRFADELSLQEEDDYQVLKRQLERKTKSLDVDIELVEDLSPRDGATDRRASASGANQDDEEEAVTKIEYRAIGKPNLTYKIKILLSFFQIATNMTAQLDMPWPNTFMKFVNVFSVLNLDFVQWSNVNCVTRVDYFIKLVLICIVPMVFISLLLLVYYLPHHIRHPGNHPAAVLKRRRHLAKTSKLILFSIFLLYPKVSSSLLNMYVCREIEGTSYLLSDFTIECFRDRWNYFLPFSIAMIIVYPIGIPIAMFIVLYKHRSKMLQPITRLQFGFLYDGFARHAWWFELVDMTHKLFLTSALAFLPKDSQIPIAMFVCITYLIVILISSPYFRKGDDRLHLFAQVEIFLLTLGCYIFYRGEPLDEKNDILISTFLIIVILSFVLLFIAQIANVSRKVLAKRFECCRSKKDQMLHEEKKRREAEAKIQEKKRLIVLLEKQNEYNELINKGQVAPAGAFAVPRTVALPADLLDDGKKKARLHKKRPKTIAPSSPESSAAVKSKSEQSIEMTTLRKPDTTRSSVVDPTNIEPVFTSSQGYDNDEEETDEEYQVQGDYYDDSSDEYASSDEDDAEAKAGTTSSRSSRRRLSVLPADQIKNQLVRSASSCVGVTASTLRLDLAKAPEASLDEVRASARVSAYTGNRRLYLAGADFRKLEKLRGLDTSDTLLRRNPYWGVSEPEELKITPSNERGNLSAAEQRALDQRRLIMAMTEADEDVKDAVIGPRPPPGPVPPSTVKPQPPSTSRPPTVPKPPSTGKPPSIEMATFSSSTVKPTPPPATPATPSVTQPVPLATAPAAIPRPPPTSSPSESELQTRPESEVRTVAAAPSPGTQPVPPALHQPRPPPTRRGMATAPPPLPSSASQFSDDEEVEAKAKAEAEAKAKAEAEAKAKAEAEVKAQAEAETRSRAETTVPSSQLVPLGPPQPRPPPTRRGMAIAPPPVPPPVPQLPDDDDAVESGNTSSAPASASTLTPTPPPQPPVQPRPPPQRRGMAIAPPPGPPPVPALPPDEEEGNMSGTTASALPTPQSTTAPRPPPPRRGAAVLPPPKPVPPPGPPPSDDDE